MNRDYNNTITVNIPKTLYGMEHDYRPNQKHFFEYMAKYPYSNVVMDAPTGSGKSIMAMHIAQHTPGIVFIITPTVDLMKQYQKDHHSTDGVFFIMGKSNYNCIQHSHPDKDIFATADACTNHHQNPHCPHHYSQNKHNPNHATCAYSLAINTFMDYEVVVTNYHMMLALLRLKKMGHLEWYARLVIWDEAHKFPDIIRNMTVLYYKEHFFERIFKVDFLDRLYDFFKTKDHTSFQKNRTIPRVITKTFNQLKQEVHMSKKDKSEHERMIRRLERLLSMVEHLNTGSYLPSTEFEYYRNPKKPDSDICRGVRCIPTDYADFTRQTFFKAAPQHIMMSGTIPYPLSPEEERLDRLELLTGMRMDRIYKTPSLYRFPTEGVEYWAPQNMRNGINYQSTNTVEKIKKTFKPLIDYLLKDKRNCLIHTNSVRLATDFKSALEESGYTRPIHNWHVSGGDNTQKARIKKEFRRTGGVLIGSSLHEGVDFPGKECELVVIAETPYAPGFEKDLYTPRKDKTISKLGKGISSTVHHIWSGLEDFGVENIELEEYRLRLVQQMGRLQRKADDTGTIIVCRAWACSNMNPHPLSGFNSNRL